MSRTQRLLDLLQILRQHRYPVTGAYLAEHLNISLRTLYRDIQTLQEQGAKIEGEAGLGYILRPGFMLPPLMFSIEEIEALVLGSRWVARQADTTLSQAARAALDKIAAVLPAERSHVLEDTPLLAGPSSIASTPGVALADIRQAIRKEYKLTLTYIDLKDIASIRTVWPFALAFFDRVRVIVAWCETREDFRHFRTDRILTLKTIEKRYPVRRQQLLKRWRERENITL